jgi:hypothetical protein
VTRLGWLGPAHPRRLAGSSPAIWAGLGPAPKKKLFFTNYLKRICDFLQIFLLHFEQYWFVFLYCKDTNTVLKYPVFIKTLKNKKYFVFMHTAKSL